MRLEEPLQLPLADSLNVHTAASPSSGIVSAFIIKVLQMAMANNKFSPKNVVQVYQAFAEACKYGFAQRINLGDMKDNPITNATERVMTFECIIASNHLYESIVYTLQAINNLMSEQWIQDVMEKLSMDETFGESGHYAMKPVRTVSDDHGTTHINVLAPNGDAVSVTSTINYFFGSSE